MELPLKSIMIMVIVALILIILSFFLSTSTTKSLDRGEAETLFSTQCQQYKLQKCSFSVTGDASFDGFLTACRQLYGKDTGKFSCLYARCPACKEFEPTPQELSCATACEDCGALQNLGQSVSVCCANAKAQCTGTSVQCSACP